MTPPAPPSGPDLSVRLGPLQLEHPIVNASGTMEIFELAEVFGVDLLRRPPVSAYVPKTVTLDARAGNPPPRVLETPSGMINSIGLPGEGLADFTAHQLPRLLALPCPLILSIAGFSVGEYASLTSGLKRALDEAHPDWSRRVGLEVNISCPNVHTACASIGSDPGETREVIAAVRAAWPGLLVAKLTPNVTDICAIGQAAEAAGADALAAVNTFKGLVIDRETLRPYLGNVIGGVSGPAIRPLALRAVYELFACTGVPIIGMGGVSSIQDVLDFMACGARVVAAGSRALSDPWLIEDLVSGLSEALTAREMSLIQLVGCAHRGPI